MSAGVRSCGPGPGEGWGSQGEGDAGPGGVTGRAHTPPFTTRPVDHALSLLHRKQGEQAPAKRQWLALLNASTAGWGHPVLTQGRGPALWPPVGPGTEEAPPASPSTSQRRPEVNRQRRASTAHEDPTVPPMVPGYLPPDQRGTHRAGLGARAHGAVGIQARGCSECRRGVPGAGEAQEPNMMPVCCLERLGGGLAGATSRGNREGQQRPTCRRTGPGPWTGPAVLRRLGGPEAWEKPVHKGHPPGLGLKMLRAPKAGAEEPRPWTFTDGPHGGTGHLGASCSRGLVGLAARTGCKACMRDQCRLFPLLSAPPHGPQRQHRSQGAWQCSRHPPAVS